MAQTRQAGILNVSNTTLGTPALVATAGSMPEDPRTPGVVGGLADAAYLNLLPMTVLCAVAPSAILANNIATSQTGSSGVALVLTAGTGISTGTVGATGVVFIDGAPAANATNSFTGNIARAVRIISSGNDTNKTFLISGYDIYSNLQTCLVTGSSGTGTTSSKCFKAIAAIVPSTGTASGVTVGTADVYAFPLRVDNIDETLIWWNGSLISTGTGFTAADTTTPQNSTSGEPKGKFATPSASSGTTRLVVYQIPKSLTNIPVMFGITPA